MKKYLQILLIFSISLPAISQINHWETAIYNTDDWRYTLGNVEPPSNWNALDFIDDNWPIGQGGIGYGDGDDNTIIPAVESFYMRHQFSITDISKIDLAVLHADYDDAFVAYLNGVEIARNNIDGNPPNHSDWALELHEAQMYQGDEPEIYFVNKNVITQILNNGANVLAIQIHNYDGTSSSDMSANFFLSFGINDESSDYGIPPPWFSIPSFQTHLPIVKINTNGVYIPDEPKVPGTMGIIWNGDGVLNHSLDPSNEFFGNIAIERRGQSSLSIFPKNGFGIETKDEDGEDLDVSFLNFPEEEDWILHGPYSDKTMMRNVFAMHLASSAGQYASRTRFVELMINESYEGIYVLMEKIKRDVNRLDIANLKEEDIEGDELTGGYVFKVDKDQADWYSQFPVATNPGNFLQFQYVSPNSNNIQPQQESYIQSYVDSFEIAMNASNLEFGGKRYDEYIDLQSFAENFLINELSKNVDAYRISSYFHKKKDSNGGKIFAGPVWDYNIAFGNADYCDGSNPNGWVYDEHCGDHNPFWWGEMMQDDAFRDMVKCRWETLRASSFHLDSIFAFIDEQAAFLEPALDRNFERWPVLGEYVWPNPVVHNTYEAGIDFLKASLSARINWMDANMFGFCDPSGNKEIFTTNLFQISPNPASNLLTIQIVEPLGQEFEILIFNSLGIKIQTVQIDPNAENHTLELTDILAGNYFIILKNEEKMEVKKLIIVK